MGKGRGGDDEKRTRFQAFIQDSYFSYQFLNWCIGFVIVGILFIIAGVIANQIYPGNAIQSVVRDESLTADKESPAYTRWQAISERLYYYFNDVTETSATEVTCDEVGPFVYDVILKKVDVEFKGIFVEYKVLPTKTFLSTQSAPLKADHPIRNFNAKYVQAIHGHGGKEGEPLYKALYSSGVGPAISRVFLEEAPYLIGAQMFADSWGKTEEHYLTQHYNAFYNNDISNSINNYETSYNVVLVDTLPGPGGKGSGIHGRTYQRFVNEPTCRHGGDIASVDDFIAGLIGNFETYPEDNECKTALKRLSFPSSLGFSTAVGKKFYDAINAGSTMNAFKNKEFPTSEGYCKDSTALDTFLGIATTGPQFTYVCTTWIQEWFEYAREVSTAPPVDYSKLGKYRFCTGTADLIADAPPIYTSSVPDSVVTQSDFQDTMVILSNSASEGSFDEVSCDRMIAAIKDVDDFIFPVRADPNTIPVAYSSLTPDEFTVLKAFIETTAKLHRFWVAEAIRIENDLSPCTNCWPGMFPINADASNLFASRLQGLTDLLYPEHSAVAQRTQKIRLALTHSHPKPTIVSGLFGKASQYQGLLTHLYGFDRNLLKTLYNIEPADGQKLSDYVEGAVRKFLEDYAVGGDIGSVEEVGIGQFVHGDMIPATCGADNSTACSIAEWFYDYTTEFFPEYYIASLRGPFYNKGFLPPSPTPTTISVSEGKTILNYLQNEDLIIGNLAGNQIPYFDYLFSSYVLEGLKEYENSKLLAKKLVVDWVKGVNDKFAEFASNIDPFIGIDPEVESYKYAIQLGTNDNSKAYLFTTVQGKETASSYGKQFTVKDLFNLDHFPVKAVSVGKSVDVYDTFLNRPFTYKFTEEKEIKGIKGLSAEVAKNSFAVNTYGIVSPGLMPVLSDDPVSVDFWAPCDATFAVPMQCEFSQNATADAFELNVVVDTGRVLTSRTCLMRVFGGKNYDNDKYPYSALELPNELYVPLVKRIRDRTIVESDSQAYLDAYASIDNTARTILIAFVIVGCIFILAGFIFLGFYIYKRHLDEKRAAGMELVADPFKEQNDRFAVIK